MLGTSRLEQAWCKQQDAPATVPKGILLYPDFSEAASPVPLPPPLSWHSPSGPHSFTDRWPSAACPSPLPWPLLPPSAPQPTPCCITGDTLISLSYLMESLAECTILGWKKIFMLSFEVKVVIIFQLSTAAAEKPSAMVIVILEMCLLFPLRISGISSPPLAFWDFTWQTLASSVFGIRWNFIDSFPSVENLQLLLLFFRLLLCLQEGVTGQVLAFLD